MYKLNTFNKIALGMATILMLPHLFAAVEVNAEEATESLFTDLSVSDENYEAIIYLEGNGVIGGYPDGTFKPDDTVNRAELLKILVGGTGVSPTVEEYSDCFPDVTTDWYAPYVCYAKSEGWVDGYPDGSFKPEDEVNKVEAIKMLVNSQAYAVSNEASGASFDDVGTNDWFAPYVEVAEEKGLLEETGVYFYPADSKSRAGICENIYRAMIVSENNLDDFSEYGQEEAVEESQEEAVDFDLQTISTFEFWKSWDSDGEDDGFELSVYFKNDNNELIYPSEPQEWTFDVKIYVTEWGDSFNHVKGDLLYEKEFTGDDVKYSQYLNLPYVRINKEDIEEVEDAYGYLELTIESDEYGSFSAISDFVRIYED